MGAKTKEARGGKGKERAGHAVGTKSHASGANSKQSGGAKRGEGDKRRKDNSPSDGGQKKNSKKYLPHERNVYNFDEEEEAGGERRKKDELRRCIIRTRRCHPGALWTITTVCSSKKRVCVYVLYALLILQSCFGEQT